MKNYLKVKAKLIEGWQTGVITTQKIDQQLCYPVYGKLLNKLAGWHNSVSVAMSVCMCVGATVCDFLNVILLLFTKVETQIIFF